MARVYKRKNRKGGVIWYIDYVINGKRKRIKGGPTKEMAEIALAEIRLKIRNNEYRTELKKISLLDFFERCINHCRTRNSKAQAERISYVIKRFQEFLAVHYPRLSSLDGLTPEVFEFYQSYRINSICKKKGTPIRKKTINFERQSLKTMMKRAVDWGYLKENPCRIERLKEVDSVKVRALNEEEVCALLDSDPDHWLYPIIYVMLHTGMRSGECRYLTWDDVLLDKKLIKIRAKKGWIPKSSGGEIRERDIQMGQDLALFLKKHKMKTGQFPDNFVFHGKKGKQLSRFLAETFSKITEKLGFGDVTQIHALRHTFITHLIRAGNDLPTVKELAGHKSIATTMRYVDVFEDQKRRAVESLTYTNNKINKEKKGFS